MDDDRERIDPECRYGAEGLRQVEQRALEMLEALPGASLARTRDVIEISHLDDRGIVVLVTAEAVELRLPTVEWTKGAYGPAYASRLWKRVTWKKLDGEEGLLLSLLTEAIERRAAEFRECKYCGQLVPPEYQHGKNVCHGCAEEHLGVVH